MTSSSTDSPRCSMVCCHARWSFSGLYAGGIPEATAPIGTPVSFSGIDLVRVNADGIAEYWVCSDGAALMAPARGRGDGPGAPVPLATGAG